MWKVAKIRNIRAYGKYLVFKVARDFRHHATLSPISKSISPHKTMIKHPRNVTPDQQKRVDLFLPVKLYRFAIQSFTSPVLEQGAWVLIQNWFQWNIFSRCMPSSYYSILTDQRKESTFMAFLCLKSIRTLLVEVSVLVCRNMLSSSSLYPPSALLNSWESPRNPKDCLLLIVLDRVCPFMGMKIFHLGHSCYCSSYAIPPWPYW